MLTLRKSLRETFFVNQVRNKGYSVEVAEQGDFLVKGQYTFEVGGKNKKQKQCMRYHEPFLLQLAAHATHGTRIGFMVRIGCVVFGRRSGWLAVGLRCAGTMDVGHGFSFCE